MHRASSAPGALARLEPEDLGHEAGLLDLYVAGESDHPPAGGPLHRGAEGRLDRLLELDADAGHHLLVALADQELLVGQQLQPVEQDDHRVVEQVRLRAGRRAPVGADVDGLKVAADLVRYLFGGRSSDFAPLRVRVGRALLAPWLPLHAGTS